MMSLTHAIFAVTASSLTLGSASPFVLAAAALGSQLPDCDTSTSYPGRLLKPLSQYLESRYPHRTVTHSFLATGILAVVTLPLLLLGLPWNCFGGLISGYFYGWFADVFTKAGVTAFWPSRARLVIPGNPRLRLSTGSPAEWVVVALCLIILSFSLNVHSQGGLLRTFNLWMGIPSGAVELVNQDQDRFLLMATIDGINNLSQQRVQGTFQVVRSLSSSDLLLEAPSGSLYRAGASVDSQIRLSRIFIRRGRPITSQVEQVNYNEQPFTLPPNKGSLQTYYTGILELEDAFDLQATPSIEEFQTIALQYLGEDRVRIRFTSARASDLAPFEGYFASGQILVRRIYPL